MDRASQNNWKNNVLNIVFEALAESNSLFDCIVFKGARVLNKRLNSYTRQSLDIDANMLQEFVDKYESFELLQEFLIKEITSAITNYLEKQDTVIYELNDIKLTRRPKSNHKLGWNAFEATISISDITKRNVRGLPNLKIDIASPEDLRKSSISPLDVGEGVVKAYTLERIAGEKLRALLSSLPTYRIKLKKPGHAVRVKDIYDISRILDQYPMSELIFWSNVGIEFKRACKSRYIDCQGIITFQEDVEITEQTYNSDSTIPKEKTFTAAWDSLLTVVRFFIKTKVIPFSFEVPEFE